MERSQSPVSGTLLKRIGHSLGSQCSESLGVIRRSPRVALLILFSDAVFVFTTTFYYYLQTYWKAGGRSEFRIGFVIALQCLVSGLAGLAAPRVEKRYGEIGLLNFLPLIQLFCLWGIALSPWKEAFFILTGIAEGILFVARSDYINKAIPSEYRATILSFQSMLFSVLMILIFPLLGWIGDRWSLELGFLIRQ
jgi:MFS family permease